MKTSPSQAADRRRRCPWVDLGKPDYVHYHDTEWGVPVHDDRLMFELLILEGAQAGLSWYTVLRRREGYRRAFDGFDAQKIARYDRRRVARLLADPGIIRNRQKVLAAINNARQFLHLQERHGSFAAFLWQFVGGRPIVRNPRRLEDYPATTPQAEAMARALKKLGFRFVGPTICYAHMQASGMVNDHTLSCYRRRELMR